MIAGIDPFSDDDPMMVYQKILKGKIKFPSGFDSNAKSLIKHLLDSDLTKRYGNLKNGVKDITGHRFFKNLEWDKLLKKELPPPYVPKVKSNDDISNFSAYPDSDNPAPQTNSNSTANSTNGTAGLHYDVQYGVYYDDNGILRNNGGQIDGMSIYDIRARGGIWNGIN